MSDKVTPQRVAAIKESMSGRTVSDGSDTQKIFELLAFITQQSDENEKLRGVVEAVRVAYREVTDQMHISPQPLHFALAEMDRVMSRADLSKMGYES